MMRVLDILTITSLGLLMGTEFAVSAFVNPVVWKLEDRAQARTIALFAAKLGTVMPFWYAFNLLLLILEAVIRRHEPGLRLIIVASSIWIAVILFTVLFLVPINNRMARLGSDSFPEQARREHKKWDTLHRLRVAAVGVALICFLVAALWTS
jgi:Domain of unknown function (DUF1772)